MSETTATSEGMAANDWAPPASPGKSVEGIDTAGMEASPVAMVLTDPHQHDNPIVYINSAFSRLTGYSRESACGRNCRFLQGERTDRKSVIELSDAIEERRPVAIEIVNYTADGREFINSLVITPIFDANDKILFFLGVQGARLDQANFDAGRSMLEERLTELQHRVKNHLSMILSMIRREARKARDTAGHEGAASASDTIDLLATRVESIAVLYDYISRAPERDGPVVPLGAYVGRVCAATRELSERISVRMNIDTDPVMADAEQAARLGMILSEILNNAFQHAFAPGERGEVNVELKQDVKGGEVRLVVADNGCGMGDSDWPNVEGSLGGRIVCSLMERLRGDLDVESSDQGTTITLAIPSESLDSE